MTAETKFVTDDEGRIVIGDGTRVKGLPRNGEDKFFYFQTRTAFTISTGGSISIRTTRRMAIGLLIPLLGAKSFQDQILKQNENHAKEFFNQR
jgi:hypothetical protein